MLKRIIDIIVSFFLIIIFLFPIAIIGLISFKLHGTPVFYRQIRPGRNGVPFELIKFRTMTNDRDAAGNLLSDTERSTAFGKWLRATSLDELPELWNVLKGEMSLVGPRPLLMEYLPLYNEIQARRHNLRPGITGLAQVSGRNNISWEHKFELDVWYVDNQSLFLDFYILLKTISKVILRDGIGKNGDTFSEKFKI